MNIESHPTIYTQCYHIPPLFTTINLKIGQWKVLFIKNNKKALGVNFVSILVLSMFLIRYFNLVVKGGDYKYTIKCSAVISQSATTKSFINESPCSFNHSSGLHTLSCNPPKGWR